MHGARQGKIRRTLKGLPIAITISEVLLFIIETTIRSGSIQPIESKLDQPIQPTYQRIARIPSKQRR